MKSGFRLTGPCFWLSRVSWAWTHLSGSLFTSSPLISFHSPHIWEAIIFWKIGQETFIFKNAYRKGESATNIRWGGGFLLYSVSRWQPCWQGTFLFSADPQLSSACQNHSLRRRMASLAGMEEPLWNLPAFPSVVSRGWRLAKWPSGSLETLVGTEFVDRLYLVNEEMGTGAPIRGAGGLAQE